MIEPGRALALVDFSPPSLGAGERLIRLAYRVGIPGSLLTSPMGLRLTKDALNLNIDAASMEHAFGLEDRQQILLSQTADSVEARNAFLEKRAPVWGNR